MSMLNFVLFRVVVVGKSQEKGEKHEQIWRGIFRDVLAGIGRVW